MEKYSNQFYDDPSFSYPDFWHNRKYEHEAELLAMKKLLGAKKFIRAVDIGGGFGRLIPFLVLYAQSVVLIEPSKKQREIAGTLISDKINIQDGSASASGLENISCNLVVMVRVMHHLINPKDSFIEVRRIVKPGGYFILEFANSLNAKSRIKNLIHLRKISRTPVRVNSDGDERVPFVNHHPSTVYNLLTRQGFVIEKVLSVSNVRVPFLKKLLPIWTLLFIERLTQNVLGSVYFGPSIFVLARRI